MPKRLPKTTRWLAVFLVVLLASACSNRSQPEATATAGPLPPDLQQMLGDVATLRELSPPPTLKVQFVSRSQVAALVKRLLTDDDHGWFARTTTLYRLLGHLGKDQDYESVYLNFTGTDVLGLYSPVDHELWVVHDGTSTDLGDLGPQEKQTLAHELVHALQDYHFNLDAIDRSVVDDLDADLTSTCVIEGDAVTYASVYADRFLSAPIAGRFVLVGFTTAAANTPASISRELYFPYQDGAAWIQGVNEKRGSAGIDALLTQLPKNTAYVLHPERLDAGWQPATVALPDLAAAIGGGWKRDSGGTFGEFELRNYLQLHIAGGTAASVAAGWDGDHYDVYVDGSQSVAAFRIQFSDAGHADDFVASQRDFLANAQGKATVDGAITYTQTPDGNVTATTQASGGQVVFVIGSSKSATQHAMEALVRG
jgi:hypothetical protein